VRSVFLFRVDVCLSRFSPSFLDENETFSASPLFDFSISLLACPSFKRQPFELKPLETSPDAIIESHPAFLRPWGESVSGKGRAKMKTPFTSLQRVARSERKR